MNNWNKWQKKGYILFYIYMIFISTLLSSCSTKPALFGLAIFSSAVDFNSLHVGMQQEELKNSDVTPNTILSNSPTSFSSNTNSWESQKRETWIFKNSKYTRQFLYFEDSVLVGWEEIQIDNVSNDNYYRGKWKDWPREYE